MNLQRIGLAGAVVCAFCAGIYASYAALHPLVQAARVSNETIQRAGSAENENRFVRLRGTYTARSSDENAIVVSVSDPYGTGTLPLLVRLDGKPPADLAPGQPILIHIERISGRLHANLLSLANVL